MKQKKCALCGRSLEPPYVLLNVDDDPEKEAVCADCHGHFVGEFHNAKGDDNE